jgi:type I restriction-modification system DNA methylase subunit
MKKMSLANLTKVVKRNSTLRLFDIKYHFFYALPKRLIMSIENYIKDLDKAYKGGDATEHTYRPFLKTFIETLQKDIEAVNEPKRTSCGAPDYIIKRQNIVIGYIEAKDINEDINAAKHKEQFNRYKAALQNLIITDYMKFQFFRDGALIDECEIAKTADKEIKPLKNNFERFKSMLEAFCSYKGESIAAASELAKIMAAKARLLSDTIQKALSDENESYENKALNEQFDAFRKTLMQHLTKDDFADLYAQTIAYGMFAGRIHDDTPKTFSREEAYRLIPRSNPFLKRFFGYIAGVECDERMRWIIDDLVEAFANCDMYEILKDFGKATKMEDPIIHFYETFLKEYDPSLRKQKGVYYTPQPVVSFIVQSVDFILKNDFGLKEGLSDTSKIVKNDKEFHRVQILDPACGTGAFLAEVIREICRKNANRKGIWNSYVLDNLLPRINGFELLMASYAIAHLKLDIILKETDFDNKSDKRFNIYLTNSLDNDEKSKTSTFMQMLAEEVNEANRVKKDAPIMVVLGNPPYSGESQNNSEWIKKLLSVYKQEPSGGKLKEKNPKWLNDDYVKFIRLAEYFIEKNESGVAAYINNHSFLDNPTFRGMRWHLLNAFDKICIIDLHGNSKKKETTPDGGKDENVFDIQQGVSINIFIKTARKSKESLAKVYHYDLFGARETKYIFLAENNLNSIEFEEIEPTAPNYFFVPKNFNMKAEYDEGFSIQELFPINGVGITTAHDNFVISESKSELIYKFEKFKKSPPNAEILHQSFNVAFKKGWNILKGLENIQKNTDISTYIKPISYRPFDNRYIFYEDKLVWRTVNNVMRHFLSGDNVGIMICRQQKTNGFYHCLIHTNIVESSYVSNKTSEIGYAFPLYFYPDKLYANEKREPNLNMRIVEQIAQNLNLRFVGEKKEAALSVIASEAWQPKEFAPIDILDYIYALLHSPSYREKYKEFLKIDFPKVPYPTDKERFWRLVQFGARLRGIHLLQSGEIDENALSFPVGGNCEVENITYKDGKVFINKEQYFDGVSQAAWEFYIGGYRPAQKWLKDRKRSILNYDDITHYSKIISALTLTDKIMKEIDGVVNLV